MVSEVVLSTEGFAADITAVRPLVRVCTLVDQQVVRLGEMATTITAYEFLFNSETLFVHNDHYDYTINTDFRLFGKSSRLMHVDF